MDRALVAVRKSTATRGSTSGDRRAWVGRSVSIKEQDAERAKITASPAYIADALRRGASPPDGAFDALFPDDIHPNAAGARRVADNVLPYVERALRAAVSHD